jgi:RNA polymerase subunit RPABC4/transcription elongation factor Spt4
MPEKMKTKECPSCAMEVDASNKICPVCSYEFTDSNKGGLKWIAILLAIAFLIYLISTAF